MSQVVKKTRIGVYGAIVHEEQILLITQDSGPYKGRFDLPGGGIEFGEDLEIALRREFYEELNMSFQSKRLLANFTNFIDSSNFQYHQIGLIYTIEGLRAIDGPPHNDFLPQTWHMLTSLSQEQLSPIAWNTVKFLISSGLHMH